MSAPTLDDRWLHRLNLLQLALVAVMILLPIAWMLLSSFKPSSQVTAYPPTVVFSPTLDNYRQLFQTTPFSAYTWNSLVVTAGSTALGLPVLGIMPKPSAQFKLGGKRLSLMQQRLVTSLPAPQKG